MAKVCSVTGTPVGSGIVTIDSTASTAVIIPVSTTCFVVSFDFFMKVSPPRRSLVCNSF